VASWVIKIRRAETNTAAKPKEKQRAEDELGRLKRKITLIKNNPKLPVQQRKQKIALLEKEIEKLLEMISNL